jgi:hypothetical protein
VRVLLRVSNEASATPSSSPLFNPRGVLEFWVLLKFSIQAQIEKTIAIGNTFEVMLAAGIENKAMPITREDLIKSAFLKDVGIRVEATENAKMRIPRPQSMACRKYHFM